MRLAFLLLALPLVLCSSLSFEDYCTRYNKKYTGAEHRIRRSIYESRVGQIEAHNANPSATHKKGINEFTDMTEAELSSYLGFNKHLHHQLRQATNPMVPRVRRNVTAPKEVNWAKAGATTPVKNQGGCGSCWAFAGTESLESCAYLSGGKLVTLAPQQFVDCTPNPNKCGGSGGCEGATPDVLFQYAVKEGCFDPEHYPYHAKDETCKTNQTVIVNVGTYVDVPLNDYDALLQAVVDRPITVGVAASEWFLYSGGVFSFKDCGSDVNHAVLLVGYGTDDDLGDYWLVQNSWGASWGEKGFIRLARDSNDSKNCQVDKTPADGFGCEGGPSEVTICGTCGILYGASYPDKCVVH